MFSFYILREMEQFCERLNATAADSFRNDKNDSSQRDEKEVLTQKPNRKVIRIRSIDETEGRRDPALRNRKFRSCECLDSEIFWIACCLKRASFATCDELDVTDDLSAVNPVGLVKVIIKADKGEPCEARIEEIAEALGGIDNCLERANDSRKLRAQKALPVDVVPDEASSTVNGDGNSRVVARPRDKPKFKKQESIDALTFGKSPSLQSLKKFGSVEDVNQIVSRSHSSSDKHAGTRSKKLNNIIEIDDRTRAGKPDSIWNAIGKLAADKSQFERKNSNDSDVNPKIRSIKLGFDDLRRKTSKDSSSSSSRDEQVALSNLLQGRSLRRKSSIDQESLPTRAHTPIQRGNRRAEIVAAVTQRLYTNKKHSDDASSVTPTPSTKSPPESSVDQRMTLASTAARMKLQEISRKMLARRRRISVDTQTDNTQTMRVKDIATITEEEPKIESKDASVLTDYHERWEDDIGRFCLPTRRVKEIATSTEKPKTPIIRRRDIGSLTNDFNEFGYDFYSNNDSGILSDDTQSYADVFSTAKSDDLASEPSHRIAYAESSTNTVVTNSVQNCAVQTPSDNVGVQRVSALCEKPCCNVVQECQRCTTNCTSENPVISISLNDSINFTLDSSSTFESRIAFVVDNEGSDNEPSSFKDIGAQTTEEDIPEVENIRYFKDYSNLKLTNIDNDIVGLQNVIKNQFNYSKSAARIINVTKNIATKSSVTFTKSLGTLFIPDTREMSTGTFGERSTIENAYYSMLDKNTMTDAESGNSEKDFVSKTVIYNNFWKNWTIIEPEKVTPMNKVDLKLIPSFFKKSRYAIQDNSSSLWNNCKNTEFKSLDNDFHFNNNAIEKNEMRRLSLNSQVTGKFDNALETDYNFSDDSLECCDLRLKNNPVRVEEKFETNNGVSLQSKRNLDLRMEQNNDEKVKTNLKYTTKATNNSQQILRNELTEELPRKKAGNCAQCVREKTEKLQNCCSLQRRTELICDCLRAYVDNMISLIGSANHDSKYRDEPNGLRPRNMRYEDSKRADNYTRDGFAHHPPRHVQTNQNARELVSMRNHGLTRELFGRNWVKYCESCNRRLKYRERRKFVVEPAATCNDVFRESESLVCLDYSKYDRLGHAGGNDRYGCFFASSDLPEEGFRTRELGILPALGRPVIRSRDEHFFERGTRRRSYFRGSSRMTFLRLLCERRQIVADSRSHNSL